MNNGMEKYWEVAPQLPLVIAEKLNQYHPILRQLLYNRGVTDMESAHKYLEEKGSLYDPFTLLDMDKAVARLVKAIRGHEKIAIYGDYDVDGVTSTVLLVQAIQELGAQVSPYIPDRFEEGYGLNCQAVYKLSELGFNLVISVDCGIRSPEEVRVAGEMGMDFIITDHHEPGHRDGREILPDATAVICQKREGDLYPEKYIAGVGLAYKLVEALYRVLDQDSSKLSQWLDLVAIGTVADVVPLQNENRALVRAGLEQLRQGKRQGLRSLAGAAGLILDTANSRSLGFTIGPRLNAAGRLESALDAYNLLMSEDPIITGLLAQKLDNLNHERQDITTQMWLEAETLADMTEKTHLVFACKEGFNEGVVGLVAARLTEKHYRPSIVGAIDNEKGLTRASCRSIPEFHITKALDQCADLLERHGGHAMAAGFTVRSELLVELQQRLTCIAATELEGRDLAPVLRADMEIPLQDLRPELLGYIDLIEPTGHKNREVAFISRNLRVKSMRAVGKESEHMRLTVTDGKITYDGIAFGFGFWVKEMPERVDLLYSFEVNTFQGKSSLQLKVKDMKPAG